MLMISHVTYALKILLLFGSACFRITTKNIGLSLTKITCRFDVLHLISDFLPRRQTLRIAEMCRKTLLG